MSRTIKIYRVVQILMGAILEIFLFLNGYPLWHIALITFIVLSLVMTTKVREMAIGMYLGATNPLIRSAINIPTEIRDRLKQDIDSQEELIKQKIIENLKDQPKN